VILGLDVIGNLGGVHVSNDGAGFGLGAVAIKNRPSTESITDEDFEAVFDGKCWTVKWRWKDEVPILKPGRRIYCQTAPQTRVRVRNWGMDTEWVAARNVRFSRQRNAAIYGSAAREQRKSTSRSRLS